MEPHEATREATNLLEQARIYRETDNNSEALDCLERARSIYGGNNSSVSHEIRGEILLTMADCLLEVGKYTEAENLIGEAGKLVPRGEKAILEGKIFHRQSRVCKCKGQHDKALDYCKKALDILKDTGENQEVAELQEVGRRLPKLPIWRNINITKLLDGLDQAFGGRV